jgi:glucose/arabinose dehydrogenase
MRLRPSAPRSAARPPARRAGAPLPAPARPSAARIAGLAAACAGALVALGACGESPAPRVAAPRLEATPSEAPRSPNPPDTPGEVRAEVVAQGLANPWAIAFLPGTAPVRALVTERPGSLRVVTLSGPGAGTVSAPLGGVPGVWASGQGGLLDVALDPDFAENRHVYLSYAEAGPNGTAGVAVARARLRDDLAALEGTTVLWRQVPKVAGGQHFGSRLVFDRAGMLLVTLGDRGTPQQLFASLSQRGNTTIGKVVRITRDGGIPADNPFVGQDSVLPEVYSLGHRNAQAAVLDPVTGGLWTVEHGARGGDELNQVRAGRNYGWPVITYGRDYDGSTIGLGTEHPALEQPNYWWDPVIAPSGATFVTSQNIPHWTGALLIGGLGSRRLVRVDVKRDRRSGMYVVREMRFLGGWNQRIRDVEQGTDGWVYVVTDANPGVVARVVPVQ